jgi:hypothetical protein
LENLILHAYKFLVKDDSRWKKSCSPDADPAVNGHGIACNLKSISIFEQSSKFQIHERLDSDAGQIRVAGEDSVHQRLTMRV